MGKNMRKILVENRAVNKEVKARTGIVYFNQDGTVTKKLFNVSDTYEEFNSIKLLHNQFKGEKYGNWIYKTVKPLDYCSESGSVVMERAWGKPIIDIMIKNPDLVYHAGIWLAFFHNSSSSKYSDKVIWFGDLSLDHIFIDIENKVVVTIDPGHDFGSRRGFPERDILRLLIIIINTSLKNYKCPGKYIDSILKGYDLHSKNKISYKNLKSILDDVINHFIKSWSKRRFKFINTILYPLILKKYIIMQFKKYRID